MRGEVLRLAIPYSKNTATNKHSAEVEMLAQDSVVKILQQGGRLDFFCSNTHTQYVGIIVSPTLALENGHNPKCEPQWEE